MKTEESKKREKKQKKKEMEMVDKDSLSEGSSDQESEDIGTFFNFKHFI
jgi:hypothetical protein